MLVICEDCAKKYNIDESRIKGNRARFTCNECGHIIIVDKADLGRSLLSSANRNSTTSTSSSVDLLREMEAPIASSPSTKESGENQDERATDERRRPQWQFRGVPLFVYFISIILFSLVCISLVTGYLYSEYLYHEYMADVTKVNTDFRTELLFESTLAFGATWLFVLFVISIFGRRLHGRFAQLVLNANKLAAGEYEIDIVKKGSREVRDLAYALERIRERLQNNC